MTNTEAKTSTAQVSREAKKIIETESVGVRYTDLVDQIEAVLPNVPHNTIVGALNRFRNNLPDDFYMPARGIYSDKKFQADEEQEEKPLQDQAGTKIKEADFYQPFADWIVNELEECTKAIPLGGNSFGGKWGTPDIIGVRASKRSDVVQFPTEVISAEVKIDSGLITAFGQACAYKLFSHKSYIVIPSSSFPSDIARLDSLSRIFGIGLILFDSTQPTKPNFSIRVRSSNHTPDMFYVNESIKLIEDKLF